jgi:hypothetical protein
MFPEALLVLTGLVFIAMLVQLRLESARAAPPWKDSLLPWILSAKLGGEGEGDDGAD